MKNVKRVQQMQRVQVHLHMPLNFDNFGKEMPENPDGMKKSDFMQKVR